MTNLDLSWLDEPASRFASRRLFYPCAGEDIFEPVNFFLPHIVDFWFADIVYRKNWPSLPESASFTLTLDWRLVPDNYNSFWKDRLGVKLSQSEAIILNLSVDGLGVEEAASATGLPLDSAREALSTLVRQALVDDKKGL